MQEPLRSPRTAASFTGLSWSPDQTLFGGTSADTANYEDLLTDP
jgi:hypothetical protein